MLELGECMYSLVVEAMNQVLCVCARVCVNVVVYKGSGTCTMYFSSTGPHKCNCIPELLKVFLAV